MAIPAPSENDEMVLTGTHANLETVIAGLLNGIVAHSLPAGTDAALPGSNGCDRSISVSAQATTLQAAISGLIDSVLEAIETTDGGILGVELHGVMTGRDRCTIWGQACLGEPRPYQSLALRTVSVDQIAGETSISVTLETGR